MSKNTSLSELINYVSANSSGNVTIAAPSSGYALDVSGTGRFTGALASTNFILSGGTGNTGLYYGHTDRVVLANYTAGGIDFETNGGAINMTLFPSGNLGVGASLTDAGYKLDVAGTGRFTGALSGTSATFSGDITTSNNTANVRVNINNTTTTTGRSWYLNSYSNGNLYVGNGTAGDIFNFSSSGAATFSSSVTATSGIFNTTSSIAGGQVTIAQASGNVGLVINSAIAESPKLYLRDAGGAGYSEIQANNKLYINSGNVGIGTTSPSDYSIGSTAKVLQVTGSSYGIVNANAGSVYAWLIADTGAAATGTQSNHDFKIVTNNTERMRITIGGNVGIGTTSPYALLSVYGGSAGDRILIDSNSGSGSNGAIAWGAGGVPNISARIKGTDDGGYGTHLIFETRGNGASGTTTTERMRITSGGNVLIGTSFAPAGNGLGIAIYKNDYPRITFRNSTTGDQASGGFQFYLNGNDFYQESPGNTIFANGGTERMRITSGGFFKASNNGTYYSSGGSYHEIINNQGGQNAITIQNSSNTDPYILYLRFPQATPNNTTNYFIYGDDLSTNRFIIYSNGNMVNRNGSYGTLSDIALKENIIDASSKLEDLTKLRVRNFNFIGDNTKQIGFVAQEFEEVFPSMIDIDGKSGNKSIKTSVLVPMLVKAVQELKAELDTLKNK